jgi:hypothetical protein
VSGIEKLQLDFSFRKKKPPILEITETFEVEILRASLSDALRMTTFLLLACREKVPTVQKVLGPLERM